MVASQSTSPLGMWHVQFSVQIPSGGHATLSNSSSEWPPLSCPDVLSGPSANVLDKSLGLVSRAIIIYTTKSMLDGTLLSHFRQPPSPRRLQNEKIEMTTSHPSHHLWQPSAGQWWLYHHHDKPKSLPTIKRDKAPDTIKNPHTVKEGKCSCPKEEDPRENKEMLEIKANKTIGGCVRTPCTDIFCRLNKAGTIFSWWNISHNISQMVAVTPSKITLNFSPGARC